LELGRFFNLQELNAKYPNILPVPSSLPSHEYCFEFINEPREGWWVCFAWPADESVKNRRSYAIGSFTEICESEVDTFGGKRRPTRESLSIDKKGLPGLNPLVWRRIVPDEQRQK